jgi:predicted transcriptional regulator
MNEMAAKAQISLRLPASMLDSFERIATAMERDRSWVIVRALRLYLEGEGGDVLQEAEGLESLSRGEGVDLESVEAEAEAIIAQARSGQRRKAG